MSLIRLAKRADRDKRAAEMNYAGWCGRDAKITNL